MFSPEPIAEPASLRINPRRRRRNDGDTTSQRQPRKRSRIASDNFVPAVNGHSAPARLNGVNGDTNGINGTGVNGHKSEELTFREKRVLSGNASRPTKDTSTIFTRNPKFTVSSLPALPDKLRKNPNASLRAFFRSRNSSTLAVTVTHESVSIWDCTLPTSSPSSRILSLPYSVKSQDQLPLASLINNASKDLGLVLVYPTTGKITFWEDVDSAESLKLFEQRRYGIEGSLKLMGGEVIEEVIDVESAGLVLLTSSGRLAHLTLQDPYGHPHIGITLLTETSKPSFFGGLVHTVFSSGWKNRLSAVKTRPVTKGRVEVIALSGDGIFKIWEVREAAQSSFIGEIDSHADIREELVKASLLDPLAKSSLKFLDLAIFGQTENKLAHYEDASSAPINALVLVQVNTSARSQYFILDITLGNARAIVLRVFPINVYHPALASDARAQLILTNPGHSAFIIRENNAVVISLPLRKQSDEDVAEIPSFYQDLIKLSTEKGTQIVAASSELPQKSNRHQQHPDATVLLFVKPARALKIVASDFNAKGSTARFRLPAAQSKIEQAVFFGTLPENILDFQDLSGFDYSSAEIENAALLISSRILTTSTDYLQQSAGSMDQHLVLRIKALQDLAAFLKKYCPPLSRSAKWKLLSDAERLASARALWKTHDIRVADKDQNNVPLLEEAIDTALERYKEDGGAKAENVDDLRFFFTKKLDTLEKLLPLCFGLFKKRHQNGALHTPDFLRLAPEMNELITTVLGTAYQYRQRHVLEYGLGDEDIEDGLLAVGYEDLDRFWTSSDEVIKSLSWSIKLTHDLVSTIIGVESEGSHAQAAETISGTMEDVIRLSCKSHVEGYRWMMGQSDEITKQKGMEMKDAFESQLRRNHISYLYNMGQVQRGLILAEDLEDIPALVDLALRELDFQKGAQRRQASSTTKQQNRYSSADLEAVEEQIRHFFRKFGQRFAEPFYAGQVASHRLGDLIDKDLGTDESRTSFLRSDKAYGKISWINEVLHEDNLLQASNCLMEVAQSKESNTWSKRIELSIAKLALMTLPGSQREASVIEQEPVTNGETHVVTALSQSNKRELDILKIQQQLSTFIRPAIVDALDEEAKLNNVMTSFGHVHANTHPSLTQLLKLGFSDLISQRVMGAESLIDILTLMSVPTGMDHASDTDIGDDQYYLALKVLEFASPNLPHSTAQMLLQLIWKRCIVSQDWNEFGRTNDLSDSDFQEGLKETAVFHTIKRGIIESFFTSPLDATVPLPSSVIGAGSNADDFVHRFPQEDLRGPIATDNGRDDDALTEYIETSHLDDVWSVIKELAMTAAEDDAQEEAEKRLRYETFVSEKDAEELMLDEEEGDEVEYDEDYIKEEDVDENDVVQGIEEVDDDGDVEMGE